MTFLLRLSKMIDALNETIGRLVGWALLLAVFVSVITAFARYLFSDTSIAALDAIFNQRSNAWFEVQWYLFSAIFLLGAAYTLRRNEHVRIDVLTSRFSQRTQVWIDIIGFLLFFLPITLMFVYYGAPYALLSIENQEINNAGGLATWPAKLLIPAGFLLLTLQGLSELIKRVGYLKGLVPASEFERKTPNQTDEVSVPGDPATLADTRGRP